MPVDIEPVLTDLEAETADLLTLLGPLADAAWQLPTPAAGWSVADTVGHLWFFDREARRALVDPDGFVADLDAATSDLESFLARPLLLARELGPALPSEFAVERAALVGALRAADPAARVPWYGPPMSPVSVTTARLMETWAHGQDIVDALGITRVATDRLRHVVHLGIRTREFAYRLHGRTPPEHPVRVVLRAPGGALWEYGPAAAEERVEGSAEAFALVVTQRRLADEVDLRAYGAGAREWLEIAQAFAGLPTATDPARRGLRCQ